MSESKNEETKPKIKLREPKQVKKDDLEVEFEKIKNFSSDNKLYNKLLIQKESIEREEQSKIKETSLYPTLDDPNFILKIAEKKEFNDTKFDGEVYPVETRGDELSKIPFELSTHQLFVRNVY